MAGKTNIQVTCNSRSAGAPKGVSWANLQKMGKKEGIVGLVDLMPNVSAPVIVWGEEPGDGKIAKLYIESITLNIEYASRIYYFQGITSGSKCFKYVMKHEDRHIQLYDKTLRKGVKEIAKRISNCDFPQPNAPEEIVVSKGQKFVLECTKKLQGDIRVFYLKALHDAKVRSASIDTSSETKKTTKLCADCLPV